MPVHRSGMKATAELSQKSRANYSVSLYLFKRVQDTYSFYSYITIYVKAVFTIKIRLGSAAQPWLSYPTLSIAKTEN